MFLVKKESYGFLSLIIFVYGFAWFIHCQLPLNWDVSQLIHAARLMLKGGTYIKDFYTPNPPMILYLYVIPIVFSKIFLLSMPFVFRAYVFFLASISFVICGSLASRIFLKKDTFLLHSFLITLLSVFLILPMFEFGQRDHLTFILAMPYLLAVICQLQGKMLSTRYAIIIGLLAGIGFSIKPHYLMTPFLIELYFMYTKRAWFAWIRAEIVAMMGVLVIYGLILCIFYRTFIFDFLPYLMSTYYSTIGKPLKDLMGYEVVVFCGFPFLAYLLPFKDKADKIVSHIFLLSLVSFLFAYFMQYNMWYHHVIPVFSMAILSLVFFFGLLVMQATPQKIEYVLMGALGILLVIFLLDIHENILETPLFYQRTMFVFFGFVFFVLLYGVQKNKNVLNAIVRVSLVMLFGYLCYSTLVYDLSNTVSFYSTWLFLIILSSLYLSKEGRGFAGSMVLIILVSLMFVFPMLLMESLYQYGVIYKKGVLQNLIDFMYTQPPKQSIYVFSRGTNYASPLIDYTDAVYRERFDCLWMVPRISDKIYLQGDRAARLYLKNNEDKYFFLNMIVEDFKRNKPDLVFIDDRKFKIGTFSKDSQAAYSHFDYVSYFSENPLFREQWKSYHYLTTIEGHDFFSPQYRLIVYKHIE